MTTYKERETLDLVVEHHESGASENDIRNAGTRSM